MCNYILTRGPRRGLNCQQTKNGYCATHKRMILALRFQEVIQILVNHITNRQYLCLALVNKQWNRYCDEYVRILARRVPLYKLIPAVTNPTYYKIGITTYYNIGISHNIKSYHLFSGTVSIGRSYSAELALREPKTISNKHLIIQLVGESLQMKVLGRNGITFKGSKYINDTLTIQKGQWVWLSYNQHIKVLLIFFGVIVQDS